MTITGGLVLYATLWFLVMFLLLPIGHRSQAEAGHVVPGTPEGAPERPNMRRKALWATLIAALLVGGIWLFINAGFITRQQMMDFNRF
jgi:predicted secreted protein